MTLIEIDRNPSPTILRWFGVMQAAAIGLVGAIVFWRFEAPVIAYALWGIAAVFVVTYYLLPASRQTLHLGCLYITYPLGLVLSYLVLGVIYFGLFTFIGLLL